MTAYVQNLCHNLRHPNNKITGLLTTKDGPLTTKELSETRLTWNKISQQLEYSEEISNLQAKSPKHILLVRQLHLFLDDKNFLRCGRRIHNAPISELAKFHYLLSPKHPFTKLLVYATHEGLHHTEINGTITPLRQRYWIPVIRAYMRKLLRRCITCVKLTGKPYRAPDPPPLPRSWVEDPTPFFMWSGFYRRIICSWKAQWEEGVYPPLYLHQNKGSAPWSAWHDIRKLHASLQKMRRLQVTPKEDNVGQCVHIPGCSWRARIAIQIHLPQTSPERLWGDMAIHSQEGTLVWWILGKINRIN